MYKVLVFLFLCIGISYAEESVKTVEDNFNIEIEAKKMLVEIVDDITLDFQKKDLSKEEFLKKLDGIVDRVFAVKYMSMWALGSYASTINENQKVLFFDLVKRYFLVYYGTLLLNYSKSYDYAVGDVQKISDSEAMVPIILKAKDGSGDANVSFLWKVRYNSKENKLFIVDCSVAGVSFLNNQRAEYESVLKSNDGDIDNFIQLLKLKVESLDKKEGIEAVKL